ncbi:MAG: SRPBCC family protein [Planctomycetes bacterium]|nr:SRPBCC family protein [Planctomycetota bacterium]
MLKKILLAVAALVVVLLVVVAMQPGTYHVERSVTMAAPADAVYAQVADFHKWDAWSPWAKIDPACKNTFEGAASGTGAVFAWDGNDEVGAGRMTITEAKPSEHVGIRLDFLRPFEDTAMSDFHFQPAGSGSTTVRWTMDGKNNFIGKAFCLFMDMDKMVGDSYEQGLASMKAIVETPAK